jgi:hypothetical protein
MSKVATCTYFTPYIPGFSGFQWERTRDNFIFFIICIIPYREGLGLVYSNIQLLLFCAYLFLGLNNIKINCCYLFVILDKQPLEHFHLEKNKLTKLLHQKPEFRISFADQVCLIEKYKLAYGWVIFFFKLSGCLLILTVYTSAKQLADGAKIGAEMKHRIILLQFLTMSHSYLNNFIQHEIISFDRCSNNFLLGKYYKGLISAE